METYMVILNVLMWACAIFIVMTIGLVLYMRQIKKAIEMEQKEYDTR